MDARCDSPTEESVNRLEEIERSSSVFCRLLPDHPTNHLR